MSFGGLILTNAGRNKIAAAISEKSALQFTHIQLGDGYFNGSYSSKTELSHKVMEIPVARVRRSDNEVLIECDWNSKHAPTAFYLREIGIIGNGVLCYYDNARNGDAEYIDPESEMVSKEKRIRLTVVVSDDVNVIVHTESSLYALATEVEEKVNNLDEKKVNEDDIHDWARNPEKPSYTKEEVGLENVDNTADKDKPLSTAMQEAIQAVYENANQFTLTKIAELINGAPATADTLKEIADLIADNTSVVDALDAAIGQKANQTELDNHVNNSAIHLPGTCHQYTYSVNGVYTKIGTNDICEEMEHYRGGNNARLIFSARDSARQTNAFGGIQFEYTPNENSNKTVNLDGILNYEVVVGGNFNDMTTPGIYTMRGSAVKNAPSSGSYYWGLIVLRSDSGAYVQQIATKEGTTEVYVRYGSSSSWGSWKRLLCADEQATSDELGLVKLYTSTGTSTDGTMTRKAISEICAEKAEKVMTAHGTVGSGDVFTITHNKNIPGSYYPICQVAGSRTPLVIYGMTSITPNSFSILVAKVNSNYTLTGGNGEDINIVWTY